MSSEDDNRGKANLLRKKKKKKKSQKENEEDPDSRKSEKKNKNRKGKAKTEKESGKRGSVFDRFRKKTGDANDAEAEKIPWRRRLSLRRRKDSAADDTGSSKKKKKKKKKKQRDNEDGEEDEGDEEDSDEEISSEPDDMDGVLGQMKLYTPVMYFTEDIMENLQIEVTLEMQAGSKKEAAKPTTLKGLQLLQQQMKNISAKDADKDLTDESEDEFHQPALDTSEAAAENLVTKQKLVVNWQQKVFSPRELMRLTHSSLEDSALDPLEKEYADIIQEMVENELGADSKIDDSTRGLVASEGGMMICTKVDRDQFVDEGVENRSLVKGALEGKLLSSTATSRIRQDDNLRCQVMYILAAVDLPTDKYASELSNPKRMSKLGHQQVLCRIKAYSDGTFEMKPKFSEVKARQPNVGWYSFTSPGGAEYRFRLDNFSQAVEMSDQESEDESQVAEKSPLAEMEVLALAHSMAKDVYDFEEPPNKGQFRMNVFGQIVKAIGFPIPHVYVVYELVLGNDFIWSPKDRYQRTGAVTQTSKSLSMFVEPDESSTTPLDVADHSPSVKVEVAHFGFPITMEILGTAGEPCHSPVLYMEVFGVDYWQRHISLGYGFVNIPQVPGCHKLRIPVWKPVPNIRARAREFFVGAGARLRDIKLSGVPPGFSDSVLNLYGHENQTCGSVETSFNVVIAKHAIQQQVDTADLIKATGLK
mmetsp:Transcript_15886/g.31131  ORF Transcript_15886/g.31131 Transcript_15886/m.31131 type:complete len:702 (-) Transcript_15886:13-2118(-)